MRKLLKWALSATIPLFVLSPSAHAQNLLMKLISQSAPALNSTSNETENCDNDLGSMFGGFPYDLNRHPCLLRGKVLVTGASVSAGVGTSPVSILKQASSETPDISNIAVPGASSSRTIQDILNTPTEDLKTVFAIDLFFWDAGGSNCDQSVANLKALMAWAEKGGVNLILGNIPAAGTCANRLNTEMQTCNTLSKCRLVDILTPFTKIVKDGFYEVDGHKFSMKDLRPDGLHLSRNGATVYAEELLKSLDARPLNCP